jgi:L-lactate dehydrogenase complex protein LldG
VSEAREAVLARIRAALGGAPPAPEDVPRDYDLAWRGGDPVAVFAERVAEYRATVTPTADVAATAAEVCARHGAQRLGVAPGVPPGWRPDGVELVDDDGLEPRALDALDGSLTGCAVAIAETGTIVLDGGERSGRRALTLVPDYHLCVIEAAAIVAGVPDAVAALAGAAAEGRPITLVSGPSATSDIELDRVEGVHGPRTLDVLVVS